MAQATPAPRGPGKREVRKLLEALSKEALIDEVMRMYSDFAPVREYLSMRVSPDDAAVWAKYRKIIEKEFSLRWGRGPSISVARKAVMGYREVAPTEEAAADMMLFYVEQAEAFASDVGGGELVYPSAESMYRGALDLLDRHGLHERFRERSRRLAQQEHGYGFQDELAFHHPAGVRRGHLRGTIQHSNHLITRRGGAHGVIPGGAPPPVARPRAKLR